jgi:hypothetical protein
MIDTNIGFSRPGFEEIIKRFDESADEYIYIACGYGWGKLIHECNNALIGVDQDYKILEIKEEFGGLSYRFSPSKPALNDRMHTIISKIEKKSFLVCEICGENGHLRINTKTKCLKTFCNFCTGSYYNFVSASASIR